MANNVIQSIINPIADWRELRVPAMQMIPYIHAAQSQMYVHDIAKAPVCVITFETKQQP